MENVASFTEYDYKFYMINVLGHDFVHDFNPIGMIKRMSKIATNIQVIEEKIKLVGGSKTMYTSVQGENGTRLQYIPASGATASAASVDDISYEYFKEFILKFLQEKDVLIFYEEKDLYKLLQILLKYNGHYINKARQTIIRFNDGTQSEPNPIEPETLSLILEILELTDFIALQGVVYFDRNKDITYTFKEIIPEPVDLDLNILHRLDNILLFYIKRIKFFINDNSTNAENITLFNNNKILDSLKTYIFISEVFFKQFTEKKIDDYTNEYFMGYCTTELNILIEQHKQYISTYIESDISPKTTIQTNPFQIINDSQSSFNTSGKSQSVHEINDLIGTVGNIATSSLIHSNNVELPPSRTVQLPSTNQEIHAENFIKSTIVILTQPNTQQEYASNNNSNTFLQSDPETSTNENSPPDLNNLKTTFYQQTPNVSQNYSTSPKPLFTSKKRKRQLNNNNTYKVNLKYYNSPTPEHILKKYRTRNNSQTKKININTTLVGGAELPDNIVGLKNIKVQKETIEKQLIADINEVKTYSKYLSDNFILYKELKDWDELVAERRLQDNSSTQILDAFRDLKFISGFNSITINGSDHISTFKNSIDTNITELNTYITITIPPKFGNMPSFFPLPDEKEIFKAGGRREASDKKVTRANEIIRIRNEFDLIKLKLKDKIDELEGILKIEQSGIDKIHKKIKAINYDARRAAAGTLKQVDRDNVNKLSAVICENVLDRYDCSEPPSVLSSDNTHLLNKEIEILSNIIDGKNISILDDNLLHAAHKRFVEKKYTSGGVEQRLKTTEIKTLLSSRNKQKFIINNAAPTLSDIFYKISNGKRKSNIDTKVTQLNTGTFCPISSVMDGQPTCRSATSAINGVKGGAPDVLEYPQDKIHYKIKKEGSDIDYYEAIITYDHTTFTARVEVNIVTANKPTIVIHETINLNNGKQFEANTVYKELIKTIISQWMDDPNAYIAGRPTTIDARLGNRNDAWNKLKQGVPFSKIISLSPIKNFGDLFQELTTLFKNGGMDTTLYASRINTNVIPYDNTKDAFRVGLHGDRPAGVRLVFSLQNAIEENGPSINTKAYGGYIPPPSKDGTTLVGGESGLNSDQATNRYKGPLIVKRNKSNPFEPYL